MAHVVCQNFRERSLWVRPSNQAWFDMVDTEFDEQQWYENFRVTIDTFQFILNGIELEITRRNTPMPQAISARRGLAIVLYYLSSTAEYLTIANLFGVSISFVCSCIKEVSTVIVQKMKTKFIIIPKGEEVNEIMRIYKDKWQFPMCAGAIDGTHIPIIAPVVDHADYVNRKGCHSIVMQAVVYSKYLFRDVVVGWPGSVHDARIFSNLGLYKKGNEDNLFSSDVSETIQYIHTDESMTRGGFTCGLSHSVLSIISKNFHFFSFAWSTPAGLVFLLFIFLSQLFHFIHQILHCVISKISIFHLDLTYIQKTSEGN